MSFLFSLERCRSEVPGVYSLENVSSFTTDKASVDDADVGGSSAQLHQRLGVMAFLAITNPCNFWAGETSSRTASIPAAPLAALKAGAGVVTCKVRRACAGTFKGMSPSWEGSRAGSGPAGWGATGMSCC